MFTTMLTVLTASLAAGFIVSFLVFVPLSIYIIPYCLWLGFQNNKGHYRHLKHSNFFHYVRNATRLYGSWLCRKAPVF